MKNLFAIFHGIISLSARSARTPQEMARSLRGRLDALMRAKDLIRPGIVGTEALSERTTVDAVVRTVLQPYDNDTPPQRIVVNGPDVPVGAKAVTSLALALHETATNAAKYGALSEPNGAIRIKWEARGGNFHLEWEETGGPAIVASPQAHGFGSVLTERILLFSLAARSSTTGDVRTKQRSDRPRRSDVGAAYQLAVAKIGRGLKNPPSALPVLRTERPECQMEIVAREMATDDMDIVIDYFHASTPEHLEMLGVDPTRLPPKDVWKERFRQLFATPIEARWGFYVTWLADSRVVGFSSCDKIVFGDRANMHLHVTQPEHRQRGVGTQCVLQSVEIYFRELKLKRLFCEPNAFNIGPNRTLQRAGFKYLKTHMTVPGPLNYHQAVTRWVVER